MFNFVLNIPRVKKYRLFAALYLFCVYSKGVFTRSAWLDDWGSLIDPDQTVLHIIRDGRPVLALFFKLLFGTFGSLDSIFAIRLFGLIGLLLLCDLVLKTLLKLNPTPVIVLITIISFTIAPFQFSAHMANAFCFSWASYLSIQGYLNFRKSKLGPKVLGLTLMVLSLAIYPLMSFFVMVFVYFSWLISESSIRILLKQLLDAIGLLFVAFVCLFIILMIYMSVANFTFNDRVQFVSINNLAEKIGWFVSRPLLLSYRPYLVSSPSVREAIIQAIIIIASLLLIFRLYFGAFGRTLQQFLLFNLIMAASMAPLLLSAQNQIEIYFTLSAAWLFVVTFLYLSITVLAARVRLPKSVLAIMMNIFGALLLVFGFYTINDRYINFIQPIHSSTRSFILSELEDCTASQRAKDVIIIPRESSWPVLKNLGVLSQPSDLQSVWVPVSVVKLIAKDLYPKEIMKIDVRWGTKNDSGCKVDLNDYLKKALAK